MNSIKRLVLGVLALIALTNVSIADSIITGSKPYTFTPGTTISSSQVNADYDYIINQVNANGAKNGVNSSITALLGLTTPIDQNSGGSPIFNAVTIGGTANAITVTATRPAISSFTYTTGNIINIIPTASNTSATTININSLGVKNILKVSYSGPVALTGGELTLGNLVALYYDGTQFLLINIPTLLGTQTAIASASTTDLALAVGHMALISGTTTITSFGSNASTDNPYYYIRFISALTITFNATSMITPNGLNLNIQAQDVIEAFYLGSGNWRITTVIRANPQIAVGTVNGLTIQNNAGTPNTQIDIATIGRSILEDTSGGTISVSAASLTINAATTGANALDTGTLANNTWYYIYLISNGTTTASLMSTSATSPTMPTGYVYKYRIGAVRTGGSSTFLRTIQKGNAARYQVIAASTTPNLPSMISGSSGSVTVPTWTAVATGNFVPTTATRIQVLLNGQGTNGAIFAPNNAYGNGGSTPSTSNTPYNSPNANNTGTFIDVVLETTNVYYAAQGSNSGLFCVGWTDAVNAN